MLTAACLTMSTSFRRTEFHRGREQLHCGQSIKKALLHLEERPEISPTRISIHSFDSPKLFPVRQQVNFGPDLDVLLSEMLRVTRIGLPQFNSRRASGEPASTISQPRNRVARLDHAPLGRNVQIADDRPKLSTMPFRAWT